MKKTKPIVQDSMRSPLKWPGGKRKLVGEIKKLLPLKNKKRLIECCVGGGSVFLNIDMSEYLLVDYDKDLIAFYNNVKTFKAEFIKDAAQYFTCEYNTPERYYALREEFNHTTDDYTKSLILLFLQKHGFNGLYRKNLSGAYNVPFGSYPKNPSFPQLELQHLVERSQRATFLQGDFELAFENISATDCVLADPPYTKLSKTANFTSYSSNGFGEADHQRLVNCAISAKAQGAQTLICNHYLDFTKRLYADSDKRKLINVHRSISQKGSSRGKVKEILALYGQI